MKEPLISLPYQPALYNHSASAVHHSAESISQNQHKQQELLVVVTIVHLFVDLAAIWKSFWFTKAKTLLFMWSLKWLNFL